MKIIELFNLLYENKAPAKIKYDNKIFYLVENEDITIYSYKGEDGYLFINYNWNLEMKVEVM